MSSDLLKGLLAANLAASGAILLVLTTRGIVLHRFGPKLAYRLWLAPPIAALAVFLPAPGWMSLAWRLQAPKAAQTILLTEFPATFSSSFLPSPPASAFAGRLNLDGVLLATWLFGVLVAAILTFLAHRRGMSRFGKLTPSGVPGVLRAANHGLGPATVGILRPRLILPSDFEQQFDPREQALILAHEHWHGRCGDVRVNALVSLIGVINWFNPLVHLAATRLRLDQELACDAAVVERFPGERRAYGQALLKSQLAGLSLPLGCTWPSAPKRLQERLTMLAFDKRPHLIAGGGFVAALCLTTAAAAWAAAGAATTNTAPVEIHIARNRATPVAIAALGPASTPPSVTAPTRPVPTSPAQAPAKVCTTNNCVPAIDNARPRDPDAIAKAVDVGDAAGVINAGGSADDVVAAMKAKEALAGRYSPDPFNNMRPTWDAMVPGSAQFTLSGNGVPAISWRLTYGGLVITTIPGLDLKAGADAPSAGKALFTSPDISKVRASFIVPEGGVATLVTTPSPD